LRYGRECTIGCLQAFIFLTIFFFAIYAIRKQEQRKLHTVKFHKRGTATINKGLMLDLSFKKKYATNITHFCAFNFVSKEGA
jgi:hypothetical protein